MTTSPTRQWHGDDPFAVLERVANHNTDAYTAWATHHLRLAAAVDTGPPDGRPEEGMGGGAASPPHSPFHPGSAVSVAEPVTVFHTQLPVGLPLRAFASRLAVNSGGTTTDATLALLVVARFCALNAVPITAAMTARLIVAAYRVVSKATHDVVAPAKEFCEVAGIAPWELARLETALLHGVGWAVHAAIGRPAETREHGTASEAMLEDEAAERVAALPLLSNIAAAAAANGAVAPVAPLSVASAFAEGEGPLASTTAAAVETSPAACFDTTPPPHHHQYVLPPTSSSSSHGRHRGGGGGGGALRHATSAMRATESEATTSNTNHLAGGRRSEPDQQHHHHQHASHADHGSTPSVATPIGAASSGLASRSSSSGGHHHRCLASTLLQQQQQQQQQQQRQQQR